MAKNKENPSGFNRKKYTELKKADPQTVQDYVNTVYMRGYIRGRDDGGKEGYSEAKDDAEALQMIKISDAMEEIRKIPRIGKKAEEIETILKEAFNFGGIEERDPAGA